MRNLFLFLFAMFAAVGNALFAMGQKKTEGIENSLVVVALSAMVCLVLTLFFLAVTGSLGGITAGIPSNKFWILISGLGLFFTYLGFHLLYSHFGTSSYIFYAALSIITTSFVVGILILKESVNIFHILAGAAALLSIILYSFGNRFS